MLRIATLIATLFLSVHLMYGASIATDGSDSLKVTVDTLAKVAPKGDSSGVQPQSAGDTSVVQIASYRKDLPSPFAMITNLPGDWLQWGKDSFQWKYLPLMGAVTLATAATIYTDAETYQPVRRIYNQTKWFHDASDFCVNFGDGKYQFGLGVAFALYGLIGHDTTAIRTASQVTEVILACGGVVQLLKHVTGRESPFVATTPTGHWAIFPNQISYAKNVPHYDAFPSGHVATALSTLTVIAENYPDQKWIRYIGYPAIAALGVGLVAQGIHWWSDYPLSLVLGYSFGMLVAHQDEPGYRATSSLEKGLLGTPDVTVLSDGTLALGMTWRW